MIRLALGLVWALAGVPLGALQPPRVPASAAQSAAEGFVPPRAVEREWRVRAWALASPERVAPAWEELEQTLADTDWQQRILAADAIERSLAAGTALVSNRADLGGRLAAVLRDEHPDVRAKALEAWAWLRWEEPGDVRPLAPEVVALCLGARLPRVRRALVGALEVGANSAAVEAWSQLALDSDPDVAQAARAAVYASRHDGLPGVGAARAALWRQMAGASSQPAGDLLALARAWSRHGAPGSDRELQSWATLAAEGQALERGLLAALRAPSGVSSPAELRAWSQAWVACDSLDAEGFFRERARSCGVDVALHFAQLGLAECVAESPDTERAGTERAGTERARVFLETAADAAGAEWVLARALMGEAAAHSFALEVLGPRVADWGAVADPPQGVADPSLARLASRRTRDQPEAHRELLGELAATLFHGSSDAAAEVLVAELDRPENDRAFRALSEAREAARYAQPLLAAWLRGSEAERIERLTFLPRSAGFAVFRGALLELGERGGAGRRLAVEHLQAFGPDAETFGALVRWLEEQGAAADGGGAVQSIGALARALDRLDPAAAVPIVAELLRSSRAASSAAVPESTRAAQLLPEIAAEILARTEAGRARLVELYREEVFNAGRSASDRAQVIAALAIAGVHAPAEAWLIKRFPGLPRDLETRALQGLARASRRAAEFLLRVAHSRQAPLSLRVRATAALGAAEAQSELADFVGLCGEAQPVEVRRAALLALGARARAQPEAQRALLEFAASRDLLLDHEREPTPGPRNAADEEAGALLRESLLLALSRGSVPSALARVLWPSAPQAAARFEQRVRQSSVARVEVERRGGLAVAFSLAAEGRLAEALRDADSRGPATAWQCDARYLAALARAAEESEPRTALLLAQAAMVGLMGESDGPAADSRGVRLLALRLALRADSPSVQRAVARGLLRDRESLALGPARWAAAAEVLGVSPSELSGVLERRAR